MTFRVPNTTPSPVFGPEIIERGATSPLSVRLKSQTPWIVVTAMRLLTGSMETRTGRSSFVLGPWITRIGATSPPASLRNTKIASFISCAT